MFARVILDQALDKELDYAVPAPLQPHITPGSRVRVPVRNRAELATVIQLLQTTDIPNTRDILALLNEKPLYTPVLLKLARWIADYYLAPINTVLRTLLPQVIRHNQTTHKQNTHLAPGPQLTPETLATLEKRAPGQARLLQHILQTTATGPAPLLKDALTHTGASPATLKTLLDKHLLIKTHTPAHRDPHARDTFLQSHDLPLNPEQATALTHLIHAIENPATSKPLLLHGVTGSGKTEIYLQAIRHTLALGKTALILVPEISLTPQTIERLKTRFAHHPGAIAVLHSHLTDGERHDEWHSIHRGQARIAIGARSAIFAPLHNLGLIVVDEEHETTYKQEETPRYHARDIAVLRATLEPCAILLASATPSLESYHNATTANKYQLLQLKLRVDDRKMPLIRIVDLRQESRKTKNHSPLSAPLQRAITDRLAKHEQTILFLNRRGHSTSLLCEKCGYLANCPNCSITLTYHRANPRLACHLCGHTAVPPTKCPGCHDPAIRYSGLGTEKIELITAQTFPAATVRRMDADAMTKRDAYRDTLNDFRTGKTDILIGTQMIAKGLHFPNVTLVGIINADLSLHIPDFRAGERTFQLLTQVAGRAGRGHTEGEVFIQTFTPFHPAIQFARHHDYQGFQEQENEFRQTCGYPPHTHFHILTIKGKHDRLVEFTTTTLHKKLQATLPAGQPTTLSPPAPAPLAKINGLHRWQITLRAPRTLPLVRWLRQETQTFPWPEDIQWTLDIDAQFLM